MKIKNLAMVVLGLLCAASAIACGDQEAAIDAVQTTESLVETQSAADPEKYTADYLPDADYNGDSFRIAAYEEYPLHMEEESGNIIDDAIYKRSVLAEEKYNITIEETRYTYAGGGYSKVYDLLHKAAMSGTDDYDLYFVVFGDAYKGLMEGSVPPAYTLNYTDPSQPWYFTALNENLNIGGLQLLYYTAFDKNPGGKALVFNKKILTDRDIELPYNAVNDGTWTYEKFYNIARSVGSDVNGNGTADENDLFGFITAMDDYTDFAYYGSGLKLVDFSSGTPTINQNETLFDMFMLASEQKSDAHAILNATTFFKNSAAADVMQMELDMFTGGHGLFIQAYVSNLIKLGDMQDDYGIVPYPKWTEEQDRYYCGLDGSRIAVPCTSSKDLDQVSIIKEYLSVESLNINYPAYYEVSLKDRYVRDTESIQMLEIITASSAYDVGCAMDYEAIRGPWLNSLNSNKADFASAVSKNLKRAEKVITKLMENIDMLNDMYE